MSEPILNLRRGSAALRQMRSAGMLQRMHVSFRSLNAGELAITFHELIEPDPRNPLSTLPRGKKRTWKSSTLFQPGP